MPLTPEETEYLGEEPWENAQKLSLQGLSITGRGLEKFANRKCLQFRNSIFCVESTLPGDIVISRAQVVL